ncbi:MAG TPA: hypothetical protein ENG78_02245 [Acidiferrobacteraceae bacterium]|nr:hypothetical protein [Acidiferrobacteraceae bacterium]HEX19628.1 hypothetical protein [Acidiferrobacteraceae bacterium]
MLSFITIQDLTETDKTPEVPRNVSLAIDDDTGDMHLFGVLPHNTRLGIDEPNARLLIDALLDRYPNMYKTKDAPAFLQRQAD